MHVSYDLDKEKFMQKLVKDNPHDFSFFDSPLTKTFAEIRGRIFFDIHEEEVKYFLTNPNIRRIGNNVDGNSIASVITFNVDEALKFVEWGDKVISALDLAPKNELMETILDLSTSNKDFWRENCWYNISLGLRVRITQFEDGTFLIWLNKKKPPNEKADYESFGHKISMSKGVLRHILLWIKETQKFLE